MLNSGITERDVKVIRLIAQGTLEEMKYLRQVYKTDLTNETMEESNDNGSSKSQLAGRFRGVYKDTTRKGK